MRGPGRSAARSGALQTRDRYGAQTSLRSLRKLDCVWRSRISGAPLRKSYALHRIQDTWPRLTAKGP